MPLSGKQKRQLRALGHHLDAVVIVGSSGITPGLIEAAAQALHDHELIKIKVGGEDKASRDAMVAELVSGTQSELAQSLGKTALLWKQHKKKPKIVLVKDAPPRKQTDKGES